LPALSWCSAAPASIARSRGWPNAIQSVHATPDRDLPAALRACVGGVHDGCDAAVSAMSQAERSELNEFDQSCAAI
jgi:hypothetical protein